MGGHDVSMLLPYKPGHKKHIKVRKRRANNSIYNKVPSLPMSFFVRIKGCVNFHEMTSVHKKGAAICYPSEIIY